MLGRIPSPTSRKKIDKTRGMLHTDDIPKRSEEMTCRDMLRPEGEKISDGKEVDFFRDVISLKPGSDTVASFSLCRALSREPMVDAVEYHTSTEETILSRDAVIAMACAPATPTAWVPFERLKITVI
jgi:hypothetical protein